MISVIIPSQNAVRELAPLLAALVPGAIEGLVREVLVADGGSTDETAALCEDAGAFLMIGGLPDAAAVAKCDQVLVLPTDMRLPHDWVRSLKEHLDAGARPAVIQRSGRWGPFWMPSGEPGLLISRIQLLEHGAGGLKALRRRMRRPVRIG